MSWFFLVLQGGLFGWVAGDAFPGDDFAGMSWEFLVACAANGMLTVIYGVSEK